MTNQSDEAIANLSEAVKLGVEYDQWEIEMLLTEAFIVKADRTTARRHLERSLSMAPPEKRHLLRSLQSELGVR
jgi:Flp pilus assembly protein TadD